MNGVDLTISELVNLKNNLTTTIAHTKSISTPLYGNKRSTIKGRGIDFDEVREYQPGDDIRSIDWRVSARTQKIYTKIYKEEKERPILLGVDLGFSMRFASQKAFKSIIAAHFATLISWLSFKNKDRIGAIVFTGDKHLEVRPQGGKQGVQKLIKTLVLMHQNQIKQHFKQDLITTLQRLHKISLPGSLVMLISDFQNFNQQSQDLCHLIAKRNDLVFVFIYDKIEKKSPKANHYLISDGENISTLDTRIKKNKKNYENQFSIRFQKVQDFAKKVKAPFLAINTTDNLSDRIYETFANI
jgi:uncharacterized protein (DUF58 family)